MKEKIKINEELGGSAGPLTWSADTSERRGKKKRRREQKDVIAMSGKPFQCMK